MSKTAGRSSSATTRASPWFPAPSASTTTARCSSASAARDRALSDPEHTIFSVKRLMGRTLADLRKGTAAHPAPNCSSARSNAGRKVLHVNIAGQRAHAGRTVGVDSSQEVRKRAGNPTKAVITVPAYFDDSAAAGDARCRPHRRARRARASSTNRPPRPSLTVSTRQAGTVAVYDLGGGTFDCSILALADGVFKVLATNGDTYLGGDDFDRAIMVAAACIWEST